MKKTEMVEYVSNAGKVTCENVEQLVAYIPSILDPAETEGRYGRDEEGRLCAKGLWTTRMVP